MTSVKTDMERIGLFSELGYTTIGDKYPKEHVSTKPFNDSAHKGKNMFPGGSKSRSATQAGYFDNEFRRIMEKEPYSDFVQAQRQERIRESRKDVGKTFFPSSTTKSPSGLGSFYGTFSGPINAFSPVIRTKEDYKAPGRNFTTNPGKKGTGYGYTNLTIGRQPGYLLEAFEKSNTALQKEADAHKGLMTGGAFKLNMYPNPYFDNNPYRSDRGLGPPKKEPPDIPIAPQPFKPPSPPKKMGGLKAGTFEPYPIHSTDPYAVKTKKESMKNKDGKLFLPGPGMKSRPTTSIVNQNVLKRVHRGNYKLRQSFIISS